MNDNEETAIAETPTVPAQKTSAKFSIVDIGEPESVLNKRAGILDMLHCRNNGRWYETPIKMEGLSRAFNASPHHSSAMILKRNLLTASYQPTKFLSRRAFMALAQDFIVFGNAYLQDIPNRLGRSARFDHILGKYMRRHVDMDRHVQVLGWKQEAEFQPGEIVQISMPSLDQEVYGVPEYLGGLQAAFLNENATLFRRKYYLNGSHAGFLLHMDGQFNDKDVDNVREALKGAKGPGNFRNLFLQSTGANKDSVKLIPISEVAAKDEFIGIKNTTRDDVLAAHRVPHQLIGVVPNVTGGAGDTVKAVDAFMALEIYPLQLMMSEVNEILGMEIIRFEEKDPQGGNSSAG